MTTPEFFHLCIFLYKRKSILLRTKFCKAQKNESWELPRSSVGEWSCLLVWELSRYVLSKFSSGKIKKQAISDIEDAAIPEWVTLGTTGTILFVFAAFCTCYWCNMGKKVSSQVWIILANCFLIRMYFVTTFRFLTIYNLKIWTEFFLN